MHFTDYGKCRHFKHVILSKIDQKPYVCKANLCDVKTWRF